MGKLTIKNRYATTPHSLLYNNKISIKAKGMYSFIQGKPDGWKFSAERISYECKEGLHCIRMTLKELEEFGYLQRIKSKDEKGFWVIDYVLHETPHESTLNNEDLNNPTSENPASENRTLEKYQNNKKKEVIKKEVIKKDSFFKGNEKENENLEPINESLEGYKQKFRGPINKSLGNNNNKNNNTNYYFFKGEKKEEISFDEDSFKIDPENGKLISDYDRTLKEFDTLSELKTILNDKQEYENIKQICFIRGIDNDYTIKCLFFYFASLLPEDKKKRRLVDTRSHFKRWIPKQAEIHTLKGLCETAEKAYKNYVEIIQKQDIIEAIYRIVNENKENGRHPLHGIHNEAYKYTREMYDRYNKEYGLIYAYYDKLIQQKR